jgi:hypothetical protein
MILAASSLFACLQFIGRHPGLLLVLIGVAGEIACDWKEMDGRLARAKRISAILLVVGLMMEFWEAAKSDREIAATKERTALVESNNLVLQANVLELKQQFAQTSNNVEKVDPLNQPISDIFANVVISMPGGQFIEPPPNWWGNSEAAELKIQIATIDGTNILVGICYLTAFQFERLNTGGIEHSYALTFHTDVRNNYVSVNGNLTKVADLVNNVSNVMIYAKFIPHDTEITDYGNATIYVNGGAVTKGFRIKKQKALGKKEGGLGTGFDDDGFTIIATPQ